MYSYGPPHMAEQKQDDQLEHTYSSIHTFLALSAESKTAPQRMFGIWQLKSDGEVLVMLEL